MASIGVVAAKAAGLVAAAPFPHGPASGHGLAYIMGKCILQKGEDVE